MKHPITTKQTGFTLIEIMIASVLGLFLLAGAINLFLSSSQSSNFQRALSDIQERGRFISNYLATEIGQAGWTVPSTGAVITGISFGPTATRNNTASCDSSATVISSCDAIQVAYQGTTDCLAQPVNGGAPGTVTNTYTVVKGNLMCKGIGTTPQPLINDVASFQLLYGLDDTDASGTAYSSGQQRDGIIDHYVNASDVSDPTMIRAVRYAILLRSSEINAYDKAVTRSFTLLDAPTLTYKDRRLRVLLTGTINISNQN